MLGGIGMNNKAEYTPEKVVDISNLSREDWLEYRKKGIGGSDVAAIINVNIKMYIFDHLRMYIFAILPLDRYIFLSDKIFL